MSNPNVGKYILVEAPFKDEPDRFDLAVGFFSSIKSAENHARSDAENSYCMDELAPGRVEDWGHPCYLCQVVKVFKPVPVVSVKIELSAVKEQPNG